MSATVRPIRSGPDYFATPAWCVQAILPHLPPGRLLDPCAGDGAILDAARRAGRHTVYGYEIDIERATAAYGRGLHVMHVDALALTPWGGCDVVIMNPPFNAALEFVSKALAEVAPSVWVVALLRLGWLEGPPPQGVPRRAPGGHLRAAAPAVVHRRRDGRERLRVVRVAPPQRRPLADSRYPQHRKEIRIMNTETAQANGAWQSAIAASAAAEHDRDRRTRRFTEVLPVSLTPAEIGDRAKLAGEARNEIAEYQAKKKAQVDFWKGKIAGAESRRDEALDAINTGVEDREVECLEVACLRTGKLTVTRLDTGETLRERALTASERQAELPLRAEPQLTLDEAVRDALCDDAEDAVASDADIASIDDPSAVLDGDVAPEPERPVRRVVRRGGKRA